jgi:hypothetical protein
MGKLFAISSLLKLASFTALAVDDSLGKSAKTFTLSQQRRHRALACSGERFLCDYMDDHVSSPGTI